MKSPKEERRNPVDRVSKIPAPDKRAVAALGEVEPQLRQILARHSIPTQDGKDLIQDAFLVLLGRLRSADRPVERPAGFLLGILRRLCVGYWRRKRARPEDPLEDFELGYPPHQLQVDHQRLLRRLLEEVNVRHRRLVLLRLVGGYEAVEVAQGSGLAPGSVRKSILRACQRMQAKAREDNAALRRIVSGR